MHNEPDLKGAWMRLQRVAPGRRLRAVAGAYALVCCCDRDVQEPEIRRFLKWASDANMFEKIDRGEFEPAFRDFLRLLQGDFLRGRLMVEGDITAVAKEATSVLAVIRAAQLAIVADGKLMDVEELQLARICELLGVDPAGV